MDETDMVGGRGMVERGIRWCVDRKKKGFGVRW